MVETIFQLAFAASTLPSGCTHGHFVIALNQNEASDVTSSKNPPQKVTQVFRKLIITCIMHALKSQADKVHESTEDS